MASPRELGLIRTTDEKYDEREVPGEHDSDNAISSAISSISGNIASAQSPSNSLIYVTSTIIILFLGVTNSERI